MILKRRKRKKLWRVLSSGICRVWWKFTDVSEEYTEVGENNFQNCGGLKEI